MISRVERALNNICDEVERVTAKIESGEVQEGISDLGEIVVHYREELRIWEEASEREEREESVWPVKFSPDLAIALEGEYNSQGDQTAQT